MAKCPTCGAPVNLAPDGDPKYEPPRSWREIAAARIDDIIDSFDHGVGINREAKPWWNTKR